MGKESGINPNEQPEINQDQKEQMGSKEQEEITKEDVDRSEKWRKKGKAAFLAIALTGSAFSSMAGEDGKNTEFREMDNMKDANTNTEVSEEKPGEEPDHGFSDFLKAYREVYKNPQEETSEISEADVERYNPDENFTGVKYELDIQSYFQTDRAEIPEEKTEELAHNFENYLSKIDSENFEQVMNSDWIMYGASDERPTNAWGERGNTALTEARLEEAGKEIIKALENYDFAESDLSDEQIEQLKSKKIRTQPITSDNAEQKGVIALEDLKNQDPELKNKEVSELTAEEKQELYQQARQTFMSVETYDEDIQTRHQKEIVNEIQEYDRVTTLLDKSGSMNKYSQGPLLQAYEAVSKDVTESIEEMQIVTFSDEAHDNKNIGDLKELRDYINSITARGAHFDEQPISVLLQQMQAKELENAGEDESSLYEVYLNEGLKDVSMQKLDAIKEECKQQNADVRIRYLDSESGEIYSLSIDDLQEAITKAGGKEFIKDHPNIEWKITPDPYIISEVNAQPADDDAMTSK